MAPAPLKARLLAAIDGAGPMPFEAFMAAALYDPEGGFFGAGPLRSVKAGDFLTSPEVSPWFGRCLARFVRAEWERVGRPDPLLVADVGAGSGALLGALLAAPEIEAVPIEAWAVEASPAARVALGDLVPAVRVGRDLADLPGGVPAVVIANELLDNLPMAVAVRTDGGWEERWVGRGADESLELVAVPARAEVAAWADAWAGEVPVTGFVEVQPAAGAWLATTLAGVTAGAVVVIDYGGTTEELAPRRAQGTLRTYRSHHLGPDPLLEPGSTDITADVSFTPLIALAGDAGATVEVDRQDDFLAGLGLGDEVSRLRRQELAAARSGDAMERLRLRSERTDAETLLHPRGLGDFRVLAARPG